MICFDRAGTACRVVLFRSGIGEGMDPLQFNRLLRRIKTDADALDKLYDYYYPRIILHIKKVYPGASAEDVAQEFFYRLLRSENRGYIAKPTSWVFTVC